MVVLLSVFELMVLSHYLYAWRRYTVQQSPFPMKRPVLRRLSRFGDIHNLYLIAVIDYANYPRKPLSSCGESYLNSAG
jgi:hypothetical protein